MAKKELEKENKKLLKENSELGARIERVITENTELKAQIEKMKKCAICKYAGGCGICLNNEECHNKDKFELVE